MLNHECINELEQNDEIVINGIDVGIALKTRIPVGVEVLNVPQKAVITYTYEEITQTAEISIVYDIEKYSPVKGEYVLTVASVPAPYVLPQNLAETVNIYVEVADITYRQMGDVYCFENAMIDVVAEKRGNYKITDAAGLYTYADNVAIINALEMSGKSPALTIESPLVYVESDITFKLIEVVANVRVAKSLVTMIRTENPDKVMVNGVLLRNYADKMVTEIADAKRLYLNGIPAIIARADDGCTYAYRSYDMKRLTKTALAGWDVSGGSCGEDSVTPATNIRFISGTISRLFGGGQGTTLDATTIIDGGAAGDSTYGGAVENGKVVKATVVYEYGDSKRGAYIGGVKGSVLGDPEKIYGDNEYSAEVWYFNYAVHLFYVAGNEGDIYGNVKLEQYGGAHLYLYLGNDKENQRSTFYGNAYITAYGGLWELKFVQTACHHGDAKLKLFEGIHLKENKGKPIFEKQNDSKYKFDVEYFQCPDEFRFEEYKESREKVVDTTAEDGKFILRFLENKITDGTEKGSVKVREGSGDTIYIKFPNGKNMLIDTGYAVGGQYIVKDLKDLGVEKIDYLMITHEHGDHMGALEIISEAFEVNTFIYQKYMAIGQRLLDVVAAKKAKVEYWGAGTIVDIGEVHIDVIGPDEHLIKVYPDENHGCIAMVMTYGSSKVFLGGDSLMENENRWLADEATRALVSNCTLHKLSHHGIQSANGPEFIVAVNAAKYVMTQMGEYGTKAGHTVASLQGLGVSLDDIYITGRHGMIKAVLNKDGAIDICSQYAKTTTYYADYTELDRQLGEIDESKLTEEGVQIWKAALGRIRRDYLYEEQDYVEGLVAYISEVIKWIRPIK